MVILFSDRKSTVEKEIITILTNHGGNYISDKAILGSNGFFTVVSEYKKTDLKINRGIAVFCDNTERFEKQTFPQGIIGICEDSNQNALSLFAKSKIPVISCGMSAKNTVTLSSLNNGYLLTALQRTLTDNCGKDIEPAEFKIKLNSAYNPFSVMASAAVLLLKGTVPKQF